MSSKSDACPPEVVLDLSRLLSRVMRTTPTGIDRVELLYALTLLDRIPERLVFAARYPYGVYGRLQTSAVRQFLTFTAALWRNGDQFDERTVKLAAARHLTALRPRRVPARVGRRVFLQVSPHQLDRPIRTARILRREDAEFVCLVHDLIPITHPEYARDKGAEQHRRRIATIIATASGIITNSESTRRDLTALIPPSRTPPRMAVVHLGTEDSEAAADLPETRTDPYFVCVATIEPRKNHLLILNVWKRLAEEMGDATPKLFLIGRRGWENEQVVDILERCVPLKGHLVEIGDMSDRKMNTLIRGARAVLLPSFAEGFGMPVSEALAAGVPVIASDLDALREVGLDVPEYLDPIDGLGWLAAIKDYAHPDSARRTAQMDRMVGWDAYHWPAHIEAALAFIDSL